jgi:hypothetical protein
MFAIGMRKVGSDRFPFVQVNTHIGAAIEISILAYSTDL